MAWYTEMGAQLAAQSWNRCGEPFVTKGFTTKHLWGLRRCPQLRQGAKRGVLSFSFSVCREPGEMNGRKAGDKV